VLPSFSVFGEEEHLPELPDTEVIIELAPNHNKAVEVMANYLTEAIPSLGASTTELNSLRMDCATRQDMRGI